MRKVPCKVTDIDFFSQKSTLPTSPIHNRGNGFAEGMGAHAHVRDASCFQEPILAFFSAFGLSHWTIYYLSFFSMLTLSNFSVCPNFLLFI